MSRWIYAHSEADPDARYAWDHDDPMEADCPAIPQPDGFIFSAFRHQAIIWWKPLEPEIVQYADTRAVRRAIARLIRMGKTKEARTLSVSAGKVAA